MQLSGLPVKTGDMVKFRDVLNHRTEELTDWKIGLLVHYETWEKVATVLHEGEMRRIRAEYVCKAGKKDGLE